MDRFFINDYGLTHDWIMGKIADDIQNNAKALGYSCRCGKGEDYQGEEICYHLNHLIAVPNPMAKHNSVFYTHLNDSLTEKNLISIKDQFDSFVCMSPEDAQFLIELGFDPRKVFGKVLPVRNTYIKPISIGIFSACYSDGRKNEKWLLDYCSSHDYAKCVNFVFVGKGWGNVVNKLEELGCSYEWHNVSRKLPYEYEFQQHKLSSLNYYIYMGMDGGAMGTYDAYAQDVPLCVTFDGFHKAIPCIDYSFDDRESFFSEFDKIVKSHYDRLEFFKENNARNYVAWLIKVWEGNTSSEISEKDKCCINFSSVVEKKRTQYYKLSFSRIKNYLGWRLFKRRMRKKN